MSAPKSVTKIKSNKNGSSVEYTSNVDAVNYYLFELCRGALRDVGKFVTKTFRSEYYNHFKRHTRKAGKSIQYKVISSRNTKYPRVEISFKGKTGFYSSFQEFGSSNTPRLGLLQNTVESNIAQIVEIESKYLSALEDEASALSMIDSEEDYDGDGNDE